MEHVTTFGESFTTQRKCLRSLKLSEALADE